MKFLTIAAFFLLGLGLASCNSRQAETPPAAVNAPAAAQQAPAKQAEPKKNDDDVDSVKEAFQKTGSEMEKGFKKAGKETKEFFVGEDKDKKD